MQAVRQLDPVPVEFKMDEPTRQFLEAMEKRFTLQLQPIQERLTEILEEQRARREQVQILETQAAVAHHDMKRLKQDIDKGLSSIRQNVVVSMKELEEQFDEKIKDRNKLLTPLFAALASVTAILFGLFIWYLRSGGAS